MVQYEKIYNQRIRNYHGLNETYGFLEDQAQQPLQREKKVKTTLTTIHMVTTQQSAGATSYPLESRSTTI